MKRHLVFLTMLGLASGIVGCDERSDMELRTFHLERLEGEAAVAMLTPYVREGGTISFHGRLVTVREQPGRLEQIAEVLARYDGAPAQIAIEVFLLEGGSFEGTTPLPDIEPTLRELLPYDGYRLLDQATFSAVEWTRFERSGGGGSFAMSGMVQDVRAHLPDPSAGIAIEIEGQVDSRIGERIRGTVNVPFGEAVVVASHRSSGGRPALILVVRAAPVGGVPMARPPAGSPDSVP